MKTMSLGEQARRRLPACAEATFDNLSQDSGHGGIRDMIDAVNHELTLYAEDQDGCITAKERSECVRFLAWLRSQGISTL